MGLLTTLNASLHSTNVKLDSLNDNILRLDFSLRLVIQNQERQLELLAAIFRHTLNSSPASTPSMSVSGSLKQTSSTQSIKDYGYNSVTDVISDMIMKILSVIELQVHVRGKRYRSSRDMTLSIMQVAVKVACKSQFRIDGEEQ